MIEYRYRCNDCKHEFDIRQSIKEKKLRFCPQCSLETIERIIFGGAHICVDPGITTIGKLAEVNTKKFGKYGVQKREKKRLEETDTRGFSPAMQEAIRQSGGKLIDKPKVKGLDPEKRTKIQKMTPEQRDRYILNGD